MAIQDWIDTLTRVWEIDDGKGGTVRSYPLYGKDTFPETIQETPCALTFIEGSQNVYSAGGPIYQVWRGRTDFYLTNSNNKSNLPAIILFHQRILAAAAANMQLGGLVAYFLLDQDAEGGSNIKGPVELSYGSEGPRLGLVVYWKVKEHIESVITVSS